MDCFKKNPAYKSLNSSVSKAPPIIIKKKQTLISKWFF